MCENKAQVAGNVVFLKRRMAARPLDFPVFYQILQHEFEEVIDARLDPEAKREADVIHIFFGERLHLVPHREWFIIGFDVDKPVNVRPLRRALEDRKDGFRLDPLRNWRSSGKSDDAYC